MAEAEQREHMETASPGGGDLDNGVEAEPEVHQISDSIQASPELIELEAAGDRKILLIQTALERGWGQQLLDAILETGFKVEQLAIPEFKEAALRGVKKELSAGTDPLGAPKRITNIQAIFGLDSSEIDPIIIESIKQKIRANHLSPAILQAKLLSGDSEILAASGLLQPVAQYVVDAVFNNKFYWAGEGLKLAKALDLHRGLFSNCLSDEQTERLLEKTLRGDNIRRDDYQDRKARCKELVELFCPSRHATSELIRKMLSSFKGSLDRNFHSESEYETLCIAMEVFKPDPRDLQEIKPQELAFKVLSYFNQDRPLLGDIVFPVGTNSIQRLEKQLLQSLNKNGWPYYGFRQFVERSKISLSCFRTPKAKAIGRKLLAAEALEAEDRVKAPKGETRQFKEIVKTFDFSDQEKREVVRNLVADLLKEDQFDQAEKAIFRFGLENDVGLAEKCETILGSKINRSNSLSNRLRRFWNSGEEICGVTLKDIKSFGWTVSLIGSGGVFLVCAAHQGAASHTFDPSSFAPHAPNPLSALGMLAGGVMAVFSGVKLLIASSDNWFGLPAPEPEKAPDLAEQILTFPLSDRFTSDPGVISWGEQKIETALADNNAKLAIALAKKLCISIEGHARSKAIVERLLVKAESVPSALDSLFSTIEIIKPKREDLVALTEAGSFRSICERAVRKGDFDLFNELAATFGLDSEQVRELAVRVAAEASDYSRYEHSVSFRLIDEFSLTRDDFGDKYFEEYETAIIADIISIPKIAVIEEFMKFAGTDPAKLHSTRVLEEIERLFVAWKCPSERKDLDDLLTLVGLDLENREDQNVRFLYQAAEKGAAEQIKQKRFNSGMLLLEVFNLNFEEGQAVSVDVTQSIIRDGKLPALQTFFAKLGGSIPAAQKAQVKKNALQRAYDVLGKDPELSQFLVEQIGISEEECYQEALAGCRRNLKRGAVRCMVDVCGQWGVDEDTPVEEIFPKGIKGQMSFPLDVQAKDLKTLGDIIEASLSNQASQGGFVGGYVSNKQLVAEILEDSESVVSQYEVPYHRQFRSFSCGAASGRMALEAVLEHKVTEKRVIDVLDTNDDDGTPLMNFERLPNEFPEVECIVSEQGTIEQLRELMEDDYLLVVNYSPGAPHYAVVKAVGKSRIILNDPMSGPDTVMTCERFMERWRGGYESTVLTEQGFVALRKGESAVV